MSVELNLSWLSQFPKLEDWYLALGKANQPLSTIDIWTCRLAKLLTQEDPKRPKLLLQILQDIATVDAQSRTQALADFERRLQEFGINFYELMSEVLHLAIEYGLSKEIQALLSQLADHAQHCIFRFYSAWLALNSNNLQVCIDECEKVDKPYAPIYTLHGQALLESQQVKPAIEVLKIALDLDPMELLTYFQLAKAYHVDGDYEQAWFMLCQCDELSPRHPEIATFMGMVALSAKQKPWLQQARDILNLHLDRYCDNEVIVGLLMDIAFYLPDRDGFNAVLAKARWPDLKSNQIFLQKLTWILRKLDHLRWYDEATTFLGFMTSATTS